MEHSKQSGRQGGHLIATDAVSTPTATSDLVGV